MNRGALRSALKSRLRLGPSGDASLGDDVLNECILFGLNDIGAEHDWPWLLTSAALTFSISTGLAPLPSGYVRARELRIGTTAATARRATRAGLGEFLDAASSGRYVWTEQGANIALSPIPATVPSATLWYTRTEPALTADTSTPLIPELYHQTVVTSASYHANQRRRFSDDAAVDDNERQASFKKMRQAMWGRTGPRQVRSSGRLDASATW
jgi:hypothetical protein